MNSLVPYSNSGEISVLNHSSTDVIEVDSNSLNKDEETKNLTAYSQDFFLKGLRESNDVSRKEVRSIFNTALEGINQDSCCIFVTGSDGRNEKLGADSNYDVILAFKNGLQAADQKQIIEKIKNIYEKNKGKFGEILDTIELGKDCVLNYKDSVIPTRALDSLYVWGSKDLKREYYTEFFKQLNECADSNYKKFNQKFKKASFTELTKSIKGNAPGKHFNIKTGELFYSGYNRATKMPCLRTVQYHIAELIFNGVRSKIINKEMLQEVRKERSIPNRITWLSNKGLIGSTPDSMNEVKSAYTKSLYWYQMAQNFHAKQENCFVDPTELAKVTETIHKFVKA